MITITDNYGATVESTATLMIENESTVDENQVDPNPNSHIPISQFFSEGNGGEFR